MRLTGTTSSKENDISINCERGRKCGKWCILYLTLLEHFCFRFGTADKREDGSGRKRKGEGGARENRGRVDKDASPGDIML